MNRDQYITFRATERDRVQIEALMKVFNLNRSQLIRYLLQREYREIKAYSKDQNQQPVIDREI